jgi:putative peptidoglycan lipid II flippase
MDKGRFRQAWDCVIFNAMKKLSHLTRISLLLAGFFAVDKVVAILRQVIIARQFGLSPDLDVFNVANNLPNLLFAMISGGALAIAFIPVLSEVILQKGKPAAWELFSRIANLAFLVTAGLSILIAVLAEPMVRWRLGIAPGFNLEQQRLVIELMRLNLIATLIFSLSGLVMSGLQANQHFLLPAIAPILYNFGQIFGAVILSPEKGYAFGPIRLPAFGMGVQGLVYGVILGAALHLVIQIPALIKYEFRWSAKIGIHNPLVVQVLRLLGPRLLTMLFIQLVHLWQDNQASGLITGSVTALAYGWMIMQVPETIIGTAIGTALLPTLAEHAAKKDWNPFKQTVERAVQVLIALTIPVAMVVSFGLLPLVQRVFNFGEQGSLMIVWVTQAFMVGLLGNSLMEVAARGFYARQDAKMPLIASGLTLVVFVVLSIILVIPFGVVGIALANSLAYTGEAVFLLFLLNRQLPDKLVVGSSLVRALVAGLVGGGLTYLVLYVIPLPLPQIVLAVIAMGIGALGSAVFVWKEIRLLVRL